MPVQPSSLTGLPPTWSSNDDRVSLYQFRSIERAGYLSVTDLVRDFLYDAATEAAANIVNVHIIESHLSHANTKASNPEFFYQYANIMHDAGGGVMNPHFLAQRIRTIVNGGSGYRENDELFHYVPAAKANVKIIVTEVDVEGGTNAITKFEVMHSGDYDRVANPLAANKRLEFRIRKNPKKSLVQHKDYSFDKDDAGNTFFFQSSHTGNGWVGGTPGPTVVPPRTTAVMTQGAGAFTNFWHSSFGDGIANPKGRGGATDTESIVVDSTFTIPMGAVVPGKTRWPVTGIWANIAADKASNSVYVGSEILLVPGESNGASYIPPGTVITSISDIEVVDNVKQVPTSATTFEWYETTNPYVWMTTSNVITISKGDRFVLRGNGATFSDLTTKDNTAEFFNAVVEARARIDPLANDNVSVTASVKAIAGNLIYLTNISHAYAGFAPTVYEGALISKGGASLNGAIVANVANIQYKLGTGTNANIITDVSLGTLGVAVNDTLQFDLATRQPWRLAFTANGRQSLSVAAGTSIQITDDARRPVAKIADYTGGIVDIAGLMGDVPSRLVVNANSNVTSVQGNIGGVYTTETIANVVSPKTGPDIITITYLPTGQKIYPGFACNIDSITATDTFNPVKRENTVIISQILPLDLVNTPVEEFYGNGRYYVNQTYPNATPYSMTSSTWERVIDKEINEFNITEGFINRSVRVQTYPEAYPINYFASFSKQGLFFGVWEGSWTVMQKSRIRQFSEKDAWFNWFLIQRPVHRKTGAVRTGGQSPVFCINSVGYKYWKFIVRERDVWHPTQGDAQTTGLYFDDLSGQVKETMTPYRVPADAHTTDSHAVLNTTHQIALTEDSKYLVSFLYNLTTPRFRYSDELDMIGQTAADVSMASSDVKITAYGEAKQRVYKSLGANLPYNAGLRISVLKDIYTA